MNTYSNNAEKTAPSKLRSSSLRKDASVAWRAPEHGHQLAGGRVMVERIPAQHGLHVIPPLTRIGPLVRPQHQAQAVLREEALLGPRAQGAGSKEAGGVRQRWELHRATLGTKSQFASFTAQNYSHPACWSMPILTTPAEHTCCAPTTPGHSPQVAHTHTKTMPCTAAQRGSCSPEQPSGRPPMELRL